MYLTDKVYITLYLLLTALLLNVKTNTLNPICPCIQLRDGSCFQYDTRYMAGELEDALVSFPDLTLSDPPDPVDVRPTQGQKEATNYCNSKECLICQEDIRERITQIGLGNFSGQNRAHSENINVTCTRYGFTQHERGYEYKPTRCCPYDGSSSESLDDSSPECFCKQKKPHFHHNRKRSQRQAVAAVVGTRYGISCTRKGTEGSKGTEPVSLCSSCWVWRQLPSNYFPRYINELICDDTDNVCLSGYATCNPGNRNLEVLRNDTGVLTPVILTAGTYCECKVSPNSALFSLVNGTGISSSLPPI